MTAAVGTGTTITFNSGFFAEILSANWSGFERAAIDTTNFATTTARTFIPGDLYDPGEIEVELAFQPDTELPLDQAAETVTITWPDGSTWAGSAFMRAGSITAPLEEKMTATATLKFSGAITVTPAA